MVRIVRLEETDKNGTFGVLIVDGAIVCHTVELPFRGNQRNISAIPEGVYPIKWRSKWFGVDRHGATYQIHNVPGRSAILIHPGNTVADLKGCVAPGLKIHDFGAVRGVSDSRSAFRQFMGAMNGRFSTIIQIEKFITGGFYI